MIIKQFKHNLKNMVEENLSLSNHDVYTAISVDPQVEKELYEKNMSLAQQYQGDIKKLQHSFNDSTPTKYAVNITIRDTYTDEYQFNFQKLKQISELFGTEDILIRGDTYYYDNENPSLSETNTIITVCNINQEIMLQNLEQFLSTKSTKKIKP